MKIIVLAGGLSTERDVSLSSAAGICRTHRGNPPVAQRYPIEPESIHDGGSRRAHLDAAGSAKLGHAGYPGSLDFLRPAQQHDGLYDGRIGIFSQKNIPGAACLHSFFQLLRADHRLNAGKVWHIAALGYSTFLFCIHTR